MDAIYKQMGPPNNWQNWQSPRELAEPSALRPDHEQHLPNRVKEGLPTTQE